MSGLTQHNSNSASSNGNADMSQMVFPGDPPTECAGCKRKGLSLLVCDDCVSQDGSPLGSDKQRFCAQCMIGKKVRVFWPLDEQWYVGIVQQYDHNTGEHELEYPDGDTEWVKIGDTPSNVAAREREQKQQIERERSMVNKSGSPGDQQMHAPQQMQLYGMQPGYGNSTSAITPDNKGNMQGRFGNIGPYNQQMSPQNGQDWHVSQQGNNPQSKGPNGSETSRNSNEGVGVSSPHPVMPMTPQQQPVPYPHQHVQQHSQGTSPGGRPQYGNMPMPPSHMYPPHPNHPNNMYNRTSYLVPRGYGYPHPHNMPVGIAPGTPINGDTSKAGNLFPPSSEKNTEEAPNSSSKRKSGPKTWTKEEDSILLNMVQNMRMPMKWSIVAQSMPDRTGKQCRERYVNHLNPRLKNTDWNPNEDATIFHLYNSVGSQWAKMSKMIPGRTDNGIKNRFHNLRRQLEREDEHRLRLSKSEDLPEEIHANRIRSELPKNLHGKNDTLWDMHKGIGILAAQSVNGGFATISSGTTRNVGKFGPFRLAKQEGEQCVRCGLLIPSVHCGTELCETTKWCETCTRIPPHISGNLLRECLNLRRSNAEKMAKIIDSWNHGKKDGPQAMNTLEGKNGAKITDIPSSKTVKVLEKKVDLVA